MSVQITSLVESLVAIILSWILIQLWTNFIEAFCFSFLGMRKTSCIHTGIIAIVATAILLIYLELDSKGESIKQRIIGMPETTGNVQVV